MQVITWELLSKVHGKGAMKNHMFLSGING
jgi:hypothetical protein